MRGGNLGQRGLAARTADTPAEMIAAVRGATSNFHLTPIRLHPDCLFYCTFYSKGSRTADHFYLLQIIYS